MDYKKINNLNIFYRSGSCDEAVINDTIHEKIFEKGFPEYTAHKDHLVIDVGAHIGAYSLLLSEKITEGTIHAFEPCLDTFMYLQKNVAENQSNVIKTHKIALSDKKGTAELYYDPDGNWGHSIVKQLSNEREFVLTDTLANFFETGNIKHCDLIKFNCEGAEFKILLSTPVEALKKIDKMLVLYHLDLASDHTLEQLTDYLKSAGFYIDIRQKSADRKRGWLVALRVSTLQKTGFKIRQLTDPLRRQITPLKGKIVQLARLLGLRS